tara:strand:- start:378825 stop:380138 length:1314 start_codon:yes stop_codon:yes gene_type:complete
MVDLATVKIWNKRLGVVVWNEKKQFASFQYEPSFLTHKIDLSPIKMPIAQGDRVYSFPELKMERNEEISTFKGLPGLLADSLPDRYGNQLINLWLAKNSRPPNSMNPVEQLCFIGSRAIGALEFEPSSFKKNRDAFDIELSSLVDIAQKMLSTRKDFTTNIKSNEKRAMGEILKIGTSAGGARPKALIAYNLDTGEVRSGQTNTPKGFEQYLLKLDGVSDAQFGSSKGFGRVEYAYYLMARDCGIDIMDSYLIEEKDRAHFLTKRFDREGENTRHHIQSFCGLQHYDYNQLYSYSYEQLFQTMRVLRLSYPEAEQMFRRMVFNVLATNFDDHSKNFSFRLKQGGKWELAPAYDLCYSYAPNNIWVNQHSLSINGKHKEISKDDLMSIARENSIKKGERIIYEIQDIVKNWADYAAEVKVKAELNREIRENIYAFKFQ